MKRESVIEQLKGAKGMLFQKYPIHSLALFGSMARGDDTPESDIDILVEFNQPVGFEIVDLADELEAILKHKIDLVSKKAIKAALWPYIETDLLYV